MGRFRITAALFLLVVLCFSVASPALAHQRPLTHQSTWAAKLVETAALWIQKIGVSITPSGETAPRERVTDQPQKLGVVVTPGGVAIPPPTDDETLQPSDGEDQR